MNYFSKLKTLVSFSVGHLALVMLYCKYCEAFLQLLNVPENKFQHYGLTKTEEVMEKNLPVS